MLNITRVSAATFGFFAAFALCGFPAIANENIAGRPTPGISPSDSAEETRLTVLTDPAQLTARIRAAVEIGLDPAAAGTAGHPFTTQAASAEGTIEPVNKFPWRATGKLFMAFGATTSVCSASVIGKGLLVTAAHCVHSYGRGKDGWAAAVKFEPARHGGQRPYGTWTAKEWWIPKAYHDGKDSCTVAGVVCENDLAVVVLEKKDGKFVGDVVGMYGFKSDAYGYFPFLGQKATQISQLGYPAKNYGDGNTMIRTDSLGYQDDPSNVIIGSAQTGGSSGCPWIMNFGSPPSYTGPAPNYSDRNQVVATTSWGYTDGKVMVQGASRFGKNKTYTIKSNIQSLVDSACEANAGYC